MSEKTVVLTEVDLQDEVLIGTVQESLPKEEVIEELGSLFKVFGDPTRLRILYALMDCELCVYHISQSLNMTQSAISHQLRVLRENHLVKSRRDGKQMIYSLDDDHVVSIIKQGFIHINHVMDEEDTSNDCG